MRILNNIFLEKKSWIDVILHVNLWEFTFCSSARSRDSAFICSFLRLAFSATLSALDLDRTWAISSFALEKHMQVRDQSIRVKYFILLH